MKSVNVGSQKIHCALGLVCRLVGNVYTEMLFAKKAIPRYSPTLYLPAVECDGSE
jgi:hypothetical protein